MDEVELSKSVNLIAGRIALTINALKNKVSLLKDDLRKERAKSKRLQETCELQADMIRKSKERTYSYKADKVKLREPA